MFKLMFFKIKNNNQTGYLKHFDFVKITAKKFIKKLK